MDHRVELRGDCSACQGLCCVSLGFERSEWFAFDKPAETACRWLTPDSRCAVHEQRAATGLGGCRSYDCYGAGQHTCRLFAGASWRDDPQRARAMFAAFRDLRRLHELRWLLHEAGRLALEPAHAAERVLILSELEPDSERNLETLAELDVDALDLRARRFLRSLQRYFPEPPVRRRLRIFGGQDPSKDQGR